MIPNLLAPLGTALLTLPIIALAPIAYETWRESNIDRAQIYQLELPTTSSEPIDGEGSVSSVRGTKPNAPSERPDIYYEALTKRPLFVPSRRPAKQDQTVPEAAPLEVATEPASTPEVITPPAFNLQGIAGANGRDKALLSAPDLATDWYELGDVLLDWELIEIGSDWAVFQRNNIKHKVEMY